MAEQKTTKQTSTAPATKTAAAKELNGVELPQYERYVIKPNDTFDKVAKNFKAYGCSTSSIIKANPDVDPKKLRPGQQILVPIGFSASTQKESRTSKEEGVVTQKVSSAPSSPKNLTAPKHEEILTIETRWYKLQPGDTFGKLAAGQQKALDQVRSLNPTIDEAHLQVGTHIRLPLEIAKRLGVAEVESREKTKLAATESIKVLTNFRSVVEAELKTKNPSAPQPFVMSTKSRQAPEAIASLNKLLRLAGVDDVPQSGIYTDKTALAVMRFQESRSIPVDGKIGPATFDALLREFQDQSPSKENIALITSSRVESLTAVAQGSAKFTTSAHPESISMMDRERVRELQFLLKEAGYKIKVSPDGIYDETTRGVVRDFQIRCMGIPAGKASGMAGPETIHALMKRQSLYLEALRDVMTREGGVANDVFDAGGLTNRGVTQDTYDSWRNSHRLTPREVTSITSDELRALYREKYWNLAWCNELPAGVSLLTMHVAVLSGPEKALAQLTEVAEKFNVKPENLKNCSSDQLHQIVDAFGERRKLHHETRARKVASQRRFLKGWLDRLSGNVSLAHELIDRESKEARNSNGPTFG
jgi:lysozyme family protein